MHPTFPAADLERVRQERLTALLQARDDPEQITPVAFQRLLFGPTHRYGTAGIGTPTTVKSLTAADLSAFHQRFYQPSNARLVVVGDVTADAALAQLERQFGGWKQGATVSRAPVPMAPQPASRQIVIVDKPDAPQSQIRIGLIGVPRSTPDFFTLEVLNTILGGSFTSRLNQNLREEHQYTYGASSRFDMRLSAGPFLTGAAVQTDKTADALKEFFNELTNISKPIAAAELARAKNYVALSFPSDFETSGDLALRLEEMLIYNLPENYFAKYVDNVQAVTAAAVQKAAATYILPARMLVVVVGDRKAIEAPIGALNLAPVRVVSVEEALGQ
jgi:predicted Zn-dependent peptidase